MRHRIAPHRVSTTRECSFPWSCQWAPMSGLATSSPAYTVCNQLWTLNTSLYILKRTFVFAEKTEWWFDLDAAALCLSSDHMQPRVQSDLMGPYFLLSNSGASDRSSICGSCVFTAQQRRRRVTLVFFLSCCGFRKMQQTHFRNICHVRK